MFKALRQLTNSLLSPAKSPSSSPQRVPSAANPSPAAANRALRVRKLVRETPDAVVLYFETADGSALPPFEPGQFLNVCVELQGEPVWRSYSICTSPACGELAVAIKRVDGGRVSTYVNQQVCEGQLLTVRGPSGTFLLPQGARRVLLVAGGSGITPLLSQAKHLLRQQPDSHVTLLYGNRSEHDIIFRGELSALCAQFPERLAVRHVLTTPTSAFEHGHGMLDQDTAQRELTALGVAQRPFDAHMLCGPEPMMNAVRAALLALGAPADSIREERFTAAKASVLASDGQGQAIELVLAAGAPASVVTAAGETILDAALRNKVPLDFSCTVGMCGTCMGRLREGRVQMEEPNCLTDEQRAEGLILPCVSRPTSACRVEFGA